MSATQAPATEGRELESGPSRWLMVAVLGGMFLSMLDQTIVGPALPDITADIGGENLYSWFVSAYLLTTTVSVPLYGRLSDVYGRKPLLLTGLGIFIAGSALCALAQTSWQLIAARALQGLGAGALIPLSLALLFDLFPGRAMGKVQGWIGAVMGVSYVTGPMLGGLLNDHAGWPWIFLVNVPIGVVLAAVVVIRLPHRPGTAERARPDYLGIAVFSAAVSLLMVGLTQKGLTGADGRLHHWTDWPVLGYLLAALALLAVFLLIELRVSEPLIPLGLFRNPVYTATNVASFATAFAMYSAIIFLPRYLRDARDYSAVASGVLIYPLLIGIVVGSFAAGAIIGATRRYKLLLASVQLLTGIGAVCFLWLEADTPLPVLSVWMATLGLGIGPMLSGLTITVQNSVPIEHIGTATGKVTFFRQIGGAVALTFAGSIYMETMTDHAPAVGPQQAAAEAAAQVLPLLGALGAGTAFLAMLLVPRRPLWLLGDGGD
ncbi:MULTISPECIES: MDR family MFS transporter [Thermomonospora]|uniref:Major facilitator superfamily MFS_1 n=1 Tax=Thermomonospora curvata (strain ATCC 19995 / DSM 43183 / JCM 3096 / KCTC 9072 / NBRC 15933 / NCIMB 10081 / Henssen B9) TaxID=471852 RepID=D1AEL3_THECD|nr:MULTISPECIES: MDR family MFS transporter [Thermomonospora]ACY95829.1 major facilitator superfamily MFS_1 [Thermomonospora curvata DSM 43183]PKK16081.1 MAG: MFS transporter [Thermomonospora sp. CIF 1]